MNHHKVLVYTVPAVTLLVIGIVFLIISNNASDVSTINSFDKCAEAGYPVLESYPRQCKTPDGRTFVEEVEIVNSIPKTNCELDENCRLINQDLGYRCCWVGACDAIDYSQDKWIAVNKAWFEKGRAASCPPTEECGPAPLCAAKAVNLDFTAQCIDQICQKTQNKR